MADGLDPISVATVEVYIVGEVGTRDDLPAGVSPSDLDYSEEVRGRVRSLASGEASLSLNQFDSPDVGELEDGDVNDVVIQGPDTPEFRNFLDTATPAELQELVTELAPPPFSESNITVTCQPISDEVVEGEEVRLSAVVDNGNYEPAYVYLFWDVGDETYENDATVGPRSEREVNISKTTSLPPGEYDVELTVEAMVDA